MANKLPLKLRINKKKHFFVIMSFLFFVTGFSQKITVSGVISDDKENQPLPGVAIFEKGTDNGTITDFDGIYNIEVEVGKILVFSYVGFETFEQKVTDAKMNIKLQYNAIELDDVVVIGYGAVKEKEVTGAVAQVKAAELENIVTSDVGSALQGQVAGVNVVASGEPGEPASIQIRGVSSIIGDNSPLYVIDGIPQDGIPNIAPNIIETIDILKDAASASIYGARASSGVILITTKKGKSGKTSVSLNITSGLKKINSGTPLLNARESLFVTFNDDPVGNRRVLNISDRQLVNDSNIIDVIQNDNAPTQRINLNIRGGKDDLRFNVSGGVFNQEGIIINSSFTRVNGRLNLNYTKGKWDFFTGVGFTSETRERPNQNILTQGVRALPNQNQVNPELREVIANGNANSFRTINTLTALNTLSRGKGDRYNVNFRAGYDLNDYLSFKSTTGYGANYSVNNRSSPQFTVIEISQFTDIPIIDTNMERSFVSEASDRETNFATSGQLNYIREFGKHSINLLTVMSYEARTNANFGASRRGLLSGIPVLNQGTINFSNSSGTGFNQNFKDVIISNLGRVLYSYDERYVLNLSVRRDGSSRFSPDNRWGVFPSASFAWNISNEGFWKKYKGVINNFRFRASLGTTGNQNFPSFLFSPVLDAGRDTTIRSAGGRNDVLQVGATQTRFFNEDIKWETTREINLGVNLSFLKNKIAFVADVFKREREDLLFPLTLPNSSGVSAGGFTNSRTSYNIGNLENEGLELSLRYRGRRKDFNWKANLSFTKVKNRITRINGETDLLFLQNTNSTLALNRAPGAFFLHETAGIVRNDSQLQEYRRLGNRENAQLGDLIYVDTNEDGVINDSDRTFAGDAYPDFDIGFNLSLGYKNFDLITNWFAAVGHEVYNGTRAQAFSNRRHRDLLFQFTPENPNTNIPTFRGSGSQHPNFAGDTNFWVEDATFLRLRNITLGYRLPEKSYKNLGLTGVRFTMTAQNALTFTSYSGFDPEISGGNVGNRGFDNGRLPITASYLFGLNVNF